AFVLCAGEKSPRLFDLGPAAAIDPLVAAWRREMQSGQGGVGAALRSALLDPILPLVQGCRGLVLAPDGELLHAPPGARPLERGCVLDQCEVGQVICGRALLRGGPRHEAGEAVVIGDPLFEPKAEKDLQAQAGGSGLLSRLWSSMRGALVSSPPAFREVAPP